MEGVAGPGNTGGLLTLLRWSRSWRELETETEREREMVGGSEIEQAFVGHVQ